jgi:glyoxylase-like metal-dependent hydrolase (beta-lactamase superfamily II)
MLLIPAGNPSAWTGSTGNNTYLLTGVIPTLIDAGVGAPAHIDAVADALAGRPLALLLITHGHPDHSSGAPFLVERWPDLRVRRMPSDAAGRFELIQDGERVDAGDTTLSVVATPGHSPDHCCFFDERTGDLFCGDLLRAGGTVVIPASRGGNLEQYLSSLRRIRALAPRRLLPGHGPLIDSPEAIIDNYLRHRAEREAQVLRALEAGHRTPDDIAAAIYEGLSPALRPAASESVLAHLIKLRDEHRIREEAGRWVSLGEAGTAR